MSEALALALGACAAVGGLAWLWLGRAAGRAKRLAFRVFLLLLTIGLVALGRRTGIFALVSPGFRVLLGGTVLLVVVGNLVGVRFCDACGRMHRNLRVATCRRCGFALPQHGLTDRRKRAPQDPLDPLGKRGRR